MTANIDELTPNKEQSRKAEDTKVILDRMSEKFWEYVELGNALTGPIRLSLKQKRFVDAFDRLHEWGGHWQIRYAPSYDYGWGADMDAEWQIRLTDAYDDYNWTDGKIYVSSSDSLAEAIEEALARWREKITKEQKP